MLCYSFDLDTERKKEEEGQAERGGGRVRSMASGRERKRGERKQAENREETVGGEIISKHGRQHLESISDRTDKRIRSSYGTAPKSNQ